MVDLMMMWQSMAAWFTPTVLFCVANFIIISIFIASNKNHHHQHTDSSSFTPIAWFSSVLDRARSIKLSNYTTKESQHQYPPASTQSKTTNYSSTSRLALSIFTSSNHVTGVTPSDLPESEGDSGSQLARVDSQAESDQITNEPGQLVRVPSFLDRVKSFKISSAFKSGPDSTQTEPVRKSIAEMTKSRSEVRIADHDEDYDDLDLRRPETARESRNNLYEEVDAQADDFISKFKQQLRLQRLESFVRYNEMLNRSR